MTSVLETPRLVLQPLELADAAAVQLLFPHWEIVRYLAKVPWPYPEDGSLIYYRDFALPAVARGQEWHWTLRRKEKPDQVIGAICLATGETNRGFWLVPEWQRQGLMTEAVHAVTDYWFEVLGFPLMRILKAADNIASRRISEKSGMRVVGTEEREYVSGTLLTEIWEITAEEWRERHGIYNASAKSRRLAGKRQLNLDSEFGLMVGILGPLDCLDEVLTCFLSLRDCNAEEHKCDLRQPCGKEQRRHWPIVLTSH